MDTPAAGDLGVRGAIADYLNNKYGAGVGAENIYMTVGAAASLTISLTALANEGDEVIVLAPFFPEYRVFVERTGAKLVVVQSDPVDFQIDFDALSAAINERTKALIVNSISDEPYRELVYGDVRVPFLTNEYDNTIVCYSFSKSLSLPGERIGYILVSPKMNEWKNIFFAVCGAGRALGFVCAPALFQYMVPECLGLTSDLSVYDKNRTLLYEALTEYGYRAIRPDGAFYLFVETPEPDAVAFCERAKKYELLLVPSNDFGCGGFVRISYCVTTAQIERSLPAFKALAEEYGLGK